MDSAFEIRKLKPDEKISEPGFYEISLDRHHNQPCDGVSVTSGILRRIELQTPADVWATHALNPNRVATGDSDALRLGRVMATLIELGPEAARERVLVLPGAKESLTLLEMIRMVEAGETPDSGRPSRPTFDQVKRYLDGNPTPSGARSFEFWKAVEEDPRDQVTQEEWDTILAMGAVLAADPVASAALGGIPEITMAWLDDAAQVWCLSRPDQMAFSGMISDYKTASGRGRPFSADVCDRSITDYGYDMQMAFAAEGFEALTGQWPDAVGLVFQAKEPPHHVLLREISEDDLRIGMFRNRRARKTFRECLDTGNWWGPGETTGVYRRPEWQMKRLLEEMGSSGLTE